MKEDSGTTETEGGGAGRLPSGHLAAPEEPRIARDPSRPPWTLVDERRCDGPTARRMLVLLAPLSGGVLGSECLDADHSHAARAIKMPVGLDAVADHPATTVLAHRRHLVDPH